LSLKRFLGFGLQRTDWLSVRATDGEEWNGRNWRSKFVLSVVECRGNVGLHNEGIRGRIRSAEYITGVVNRVKKRSKYGAKKPKK